MTKPITLRAAMALLMIVLGNLQAWDSDVHEAGLVFVFLVSLAIALPAVILLIPLQSSFFVGAILLSLVLLVLARILSPVELPGLFIILVPAAMGLTFTGLFSQNLTKS